MNLTSILSDLVSELGALSGLPGLALDGSGHASILFNGTTNVHMQARAEDILLYGVLGALASDQVATLLLRANFLWQHTAGATFSLSDSGHIVLCLKMGADALTFESFQQRLVAFAQSLQQWHDQLAAHAAETPSGDESHADGDIPHFAIPI